MPPKRKSQAPPGGPVTPGKRAPPIPLDYERDSTAAPAPRPVHLCRQRAHPPALPTTEGLVFMVLDVVEEMQGQFNIWGITPAGASVLLRLSDFHPYFYIAAPKGQVAAERAGADSTEIVDEEVNWDEPQQLDRLKGLLNHHLPSDSRLVAVKAVRRTPILFYRPDKQEGEVYLQLVFRLGSSAKRASTAVLRALSSGHLRREGLVWRDLTLYEADVSPLQRLLVDVPVSGGAWLYVLPVAPSGASGSAPAGPATGRGDPSSPPPLRAAGAGGWRSVPEPERISSCDVEVAAPWQAVCCLTPDATQLAEPAWSPIPGSIGSSRSGSDTEGEQSAAQHEAAPQEVQHAAEAAKRGDIAGLRMMVLDVLSATVDGSDRVAVAAQGDPVVTISCTFYTFAARGHAEAPAADKEQQQQQEGPSREASADYCGGGGEDDGEDAVVVASLAEVVGGPTGAGARCPSNVPGIVPGAAPGVAEAESETLVFLLHPATAARRQEAVEHSVGQQVGGGGTARLLLFQTEAELLLSWVQCVREADPDVIALFEVNDTLALLQQRFAALRLEGGALWLSRLLPCAAKPMSIRKVTMYSAQWVRSQSRMSSTSNQETWRADIDGRVVVDVLRQVLTAQNLASFSLIDCVQSLLGQTIEVLRPSRLAGLVCLAGPPPQQLHHQRLSPAAAAEADAMRVARYALRRGNAVGSLLHRLATVPEMIEMARATGLTLGQAVYQAQMIRINSLLLRTARRQHFLVPGRQEGQILQEHTFILHPVEKGQYRLVLWNVLCCGLVAGEREDPLALSKSPFLLHPVDNGTVGLYRQPVAILDFASLYPSIYRAHNLCYSTLVHKEDEGRLAPEELTITPTGAAFVKPSVRKGILPGILAALIAARRATREQLRAASDPAARAVLDSRQKALKVTANALYGFTGAGASPLQCSQLADSCLAYGAQCCRRAKEVVEAAAAGGQLAPYGGGACIIYGHTDSLFVLLPQAADARQAIMAGRLASKLVSSAFLSPIELKFERVCQPFLLLHVNRYAGRAFEREEDVERGGELICKGVKSMWRQAAPILRTTLHGALVRILMWDDIRGALEFVSDEVRRLLSGQVELHELVMTGGLWRVTGQQVENAAAAAGGEEGLHPEDVKGPHASLAVRLSQRDPGRSFVLGERLPYVLLSGERLQDNAAEDPLTAAKAGQEGDYSLYWKNKLRKPLEEVFRACVPPSQQQAVMNELLGGDHTRVKVDSISPPAPVVGPASPPPRGARGGGGGRGAGTARQSQMAMFFTPIAKCLGCKASMPSFKGPLEEAPGLCDSCSSTEGKWEETYMALLGEQAGAEARQCAAYAACHPCHSGGALGPVLCENGECPVTYTRLACSSRLQQLDKQLRRLDIF